MSFDHGSRSVLTRRDLGRFEGETLFARIARAVCEAECLPRKELYEAWEVARRTHRRLRGDRVVELACGHALAAHCLLLLDASLASALAIDRHVPASAARLSAALGERWPALRGRVELREAELSEPPLVESDLVLSIHACGALTDRVIDRALVASASLAVLPCCHERATCDTGALDGWMDVSLAIDATRAARLRHAGYRVSTSLIPGAITPKNRLLLAAPLAV